jgi:hypothetical protein
MIIVAWLSIWSHCSSGSYALDWSISIAAADRPTEIKLLITFVLCLAGSNSAWMGRAEDSVQVPVVVNNNISPVLMVGN